MEETPLEQPTAVAAKFTGEPTEAPLPGLLIETPAKAGAVMTRSIIIA
jgi:hypothetical protein